jgi:uncharacterized protein
VMELDLTAKILLLGFAVALVVGAVANKTNFCTMGAVSDWVNMGHLGRMRSWFLAIGIAMLGVLVLESTGLAAMGMTSSGEFAQPPYRTPGLAWHAYVVGGFLFGIGMTLGSGCGNKTCVRVGAGNVKSIFVLLMIGVAAYAMMFTGVGNFIFGNFVFPGRVDLTGYGIQTQELGAILGGVLGIENYKPLAFVLAGGIGLALLGWALKSAEFRATLDHWLGGLVIGIGVVAAWYITAGPLGQEWLGEIEWMDVRPFAAGVQSLTFVGPAGQSVQYLGSPGQTSLITFAMMVLAGVIVGSFVYSILSRSFRIEWFSSFGDFAKHIIGGLLMGVGGVLAMGCTIGAGITGVSTMALGSFLALGSIILGSALTMKVQYYKMVYEDEASFSAALVSSLVDLHLLPKSLRRLELV